MNLYDRVFALHRELSAARRPVPRKRLEERLECSTATVKRIIRDMRLFLDAPIEYDREANGYYYAEAESARFSLPGLWFNPSELVALLTMDQLLEVTEPGFLTQELAPVRRRLERLLESQQLGVGELAGRVRILRSVARPRGACFGEVAATLATRRRLHIRYHGRARDAESEREISPQRLVYYRDNWYLDAWCHASGGLRTFALDRIRAADELPTKAREVAASRLDRALGQGYGIFSGPARETAVLRFTPEAARWVADETWHPEQSSARLEDGRYELRVPLAAREELVRDVLAYGAEVEVLAPAALRREVADRLIDAAAQYRA